MEDLIKALHIFIKYGNPKYPTGCGHDELLININPELVSDKDLKTLKELGFYAGEDSFSSFLYADF